MSSVSNTPSSPASQQTPRAKSSYVDEQIHRIRRSLKLVDFTAGLITMLIGVLMFLLTAAVLEHWVIPGGWSTTARVVLFLVFLAGLGWYCWRVFWPLISQTINPAYAANTIEQQSPSLKNSLLNLLLLRNHRREMPGQVYQAIEQQANQRLQEVPLETVVDRSAIVKLGYILAAVVALCTVYRVLSPKDFLTSASRVLAPWSDTPVPSRVDILDITPGDTAVARGDRLEVTAEVLGLKEDETVHLVYSTKDQQIVDQQIPMSRSNGGIRFSAELPGHTSEQAGIEQPLEYWIAAGDARSSRYDITVFARPTLVVQKVRYDFPDYTGYPTEVVQHTGDLSAVEGTEVTITALANQPIDQAHVDFEADGRRDLIMKADDRQATVTFPLELEEDRRTPKHESYVLRFTTLEGRKNEAPPKFQIEVTPDYAPEIELLQPAEEQINVPIDEPVQFELEARDPDFALKSVALIGETAEGQQIKEVLLSRQHQGRYVGQLQKTPQELGLQVGDQWEYRGTAADNRQPEPNLAYTAVRKLRVIDPNQQGQGDAQGPQQSGAGGGEGQQQPGEGGEAQNGEGQPQAGGGQPGEDQQGEGQEGGAGEQGQAGEQQDQQQTDGQGEGGAGENGQQNQQPQDGAGGDPAEQDQPGEQQQDGGDSPAGENQGQPGQGEPSKVSPSGDDDGSAFERIAEHFNQQEGDSQGTGAEPREGQDATDPAATDSDPTAQGGQRDRDQRGEPGDGQSAERGDPGDTQEGQTQADQQQPSGEQPSDAEQAEQQQQPGESAEDAAPDQPRESPQAGDPSDAQSEQEGESAPSEPMSPEQGTGGTGEAGTEPQADPVGEQTNKPRERDSGEPRSDQQESESGTQDTTGQESDSQGEQSGDRAGGGQEGTGQQADAEGTGAAGQRDAADQGSGQAEDRGPGEAGPRPGSDDQAEAPTGESSEDQHGQGSQPGEQTGEQPGEQPGDQAGQQPGDSSGQQQDQQGQPGQPDQPGESDPQSDAQLPTDSETPGTSAPQAPQGIGTGGTEGSAPPPSGETMPGDEANLEYAQQQTDLILDQLDDQLRKRQVDNELLDKLGWSQDELRRFVDRWKNLKNQADNGDPDGKQELNDALRSLGLSPNRRTGFRSQTPEDRLRELQDAYRGRIPLEYAEQVRAYIKGTAKAQQEE